jgi:arylsulfatase A
MLRSIGILVGGLTLLALPSCNQRNVKEADLKKDAQIGKPNIVLILADDLGYGDLSCYGQTKFQTPNIDKLAREGMVFTQHYSGSTVCAPSRSALMTGQHTGHTPVRGNFEVEPEGQWALPDSCMTMAEILKDAGYITGCFGKWGLGFPGSQGDPNNQGFDEFFGYNCQRLAHHYYPYYLWHNQEKYVLGANAGGKNVTYAPDVIHKAALEFMENNKDTSFFLYYPSTIPHAELFAPEEYMAMFRGKFGPEKAFKGVDYGEEYRKGPYGSQPEGRTAFVAMVTLLDTQVGEIVKKLKNLGIAENTVVIFSSDNGPHHEGGADPEYFNSNGQLRGLKRDLYEGGIRVPMIARWPGKIITGSTTNHISAFWDILPTVAEIAGGIPPDNIDGISFLPTLTNSDEQKEHEYLYWEFHEKDGRTAIRKGNWKAVRYNVLKEPDAPVELYDLSKDIGEQNNVAAKHLEIASELTELMKKARTHSDVFTFQSETYLNIK